MSLPAALGLYTVRDLYREDFDACLKKTAEIGYTGVECFGAPSLPAEHVANALKAHRLSLVGWHIPLEAMEGDAFDETMRYFSAVGCQRAIIPWVPDTYFASREAVLSLAMRMNAIGKRTEQSGVRLGYHNHAAEFVPLEDGTLPWVLLMDSTSLMAQLDNGNALASGTPSLNINEMVARWPGRADTIHLKPYSQTNGYETMIGEDDIDWATFLYAAEHTGGTRWLIVEYEAGTYGQFEGAAECIHALEKYN